MKQIILIGILVLFIIGCYKPPQQFNYDCPDCICNCEPDTRAVTKFEYPDNIRLFNDYALLTTEEILDDYSAGFFTINIRANKSGLRKGSLCMEHQFEEIRINGLLETPVPENYKIRSRDYDVYCWQYNELGDWDRSDYKMVIEQGINVNQTVKISIWEDN